MSDRFNFKKTGLSGVWVAERKIFEDDRGAFSRLFCTDEFHEISINKPIVQINHSITRTKGTVRGLHFQHPPHAEIKIVTCLKGEIFDVAVDLRCGSTTFLAWHGEKLSAQNQKCLIIPEGCAHGFQAMTDDCEVIYFHTAFYAPDAEGAFNVKDKRIGIKWPLAISGLSKRDSAHPFVTDDFAGITL